ncbi:MAG: PASTA domain-containing protein [Bacteroidetes bacterium]|nr:PASTA domain-containing protein [Bacteroidota bacterium]
MTIYIVSVSLICWFIISWLGNTTNHGETVSVPDFSGVGINELDKFVADKNIRYLVIDSLYDTKAKKGVVIKQEPEAKAEVKEGRTIYLYVTSVLPPSIQMPKLIDRSLRQAAAMITTFGLKIGKTKFVPDQCANCVFEQMIKGKNVAPGEKIEKGTVIDLIVGKGLSDEEVGVPCLYGMTRIEALGKLAEASLSIGAVSFDIAKDSINGKVYRQIPSCSKDVMIKMGGTVDLYFTSDKNKLSAIPDTSSVKNDDSNFDQ